MTPYKGFSKEEGWLAATARGVREVCWSQMPLRYWRCAFYLALLLIAFWTASVVQEESHEGLQHLQGEGGAPFPPANGWRGGSLPPLLLNSESPRHVKIAATALVRGREASDRLVWLLHSAASQHYGKLILWTRASHSWLDKAVRRPLASFLRHAGFSAGTDSTCTSPESPRIEADAKVGNGWWWTLWLQSTVQTAVRSLPSAAHHFLCGNLPSSNGSLSTIRNLDLHQKGNSDFQADMQNGESDVETGPYLLALLLLLVHVLATGLQRACLSISSKFMSLIAASGIPVNGTATSEWRETLTVAGMSSVTSMAITFVVLFLVYTAAAAASRVLALLTSIVRSVCKSLWWSSSGFKSADMCRKNDAAAVGIKRSKGPQRQGVVALEVLAASLTCWLLLLADRDFVMFTWASMQSLRLSILSTVLLLRLPSAQVATLLSWPPPLREPALQLQRSQPLRIIDPVAVGSMVGCILAALSLSLLWQTAGQVRLAVKHKFFSTNTKPVKSCLQPVRCTRGNWITRGSPVEGEGSASLLQQLQEERQKNAELVKLLDSEQHRVAGSEHRVGQLRGLSEPHSQATQQEVLTPRKSLQQQPEIQVDVGPVTTPAYEALYRQHELHRESARQHAAWRHQTQATLDQNQQVLEQQQEYFAEREKDYKLKLDELRGKMQSQSLCVRQMEADLKLQRDKQKQLEVDIQKYQQRLEGSEAMWKAKEAEMSAHIHELKQELETVRGSRDSLQRKLTESQSKFLLFKDTERTLKITLDELAAKTKEMEVLRRQLAEAKSYCERAAKHLRLKSGLDAINQSRFSQHLVGKHVDNSSHVSDDADHKSPQSHAIPNSAIRDPCNEPRASTPLSPSQHLALFNSEGLRSIINQESELEVFGKLGDDKAFSPERCIAQLEKDSSLMEQQMLLDAIANILRKLEDIFLSDEQKCFELMGQLNNTGRVQSNDIDCHPPWKPAGMSDVENRLQRPNAEALEPLALSSERDTLWVS